MEDIPSLAILIISGVLLVGLLLTFVFTSAQQSIDMGNALEQKKEEMDVANEQADYLQFAGSEVEGETVRSILKVYKAEPISITVNGVTYTYSDRQANFDEIYRNVKDYNSSTYINPVSRYYCEVEFSAQGAVSGLVFTVR